MHCQSNLGLHDFLMDWNASDTAMSGLICSRLRETAEEASAMAVYGKRDEDTLYALETVVNVKEQKMEGLESKQQGQTF